MAPIPPRAGGVLPDADIANYASFASSLSKEQTATAVAIALAESGGDPTAVHTNADGSKDVGLWQINLRAHPEYKAEWLKDPGHNGTAMLKISGNGTNWAPWTTYRSGAYKAFLDRGRKATGAGGYNPAQDTPARAAVKDTAGAITTLTQGIIDIVNKIGAWVSNPENWLRVVQVVAGGALAIGAILLVARPLTSQATGAVKKAVM